MPLEQAHHRVEDVGPRKASNTGTATPPNTESSPNTSPSAATITSDQEKSIRRASSSGRSGAPCAGTAWSEGAGGATGEEEAARRIDLTWSLVMVGALGLVFGLLAVFGGVAVPVLLALTGAYVFNPVVSALERRGLGPRTGGTLVVFGGCTLALVGAVLYLIPVFQEEAAKLPEFFRQASTRVNPRVESLLGGLRCRSS